MAETTMIWAAVSADQILSEIMRVRAHPRGALGVMEDSEQAAGRILVPLGSVQPFAVPETDFRAAVISLAEGEARIVLIDARAPGRGAFRRLVDGIHAAGFTPVVVAPMGLRMPAILRRWGWQERVVGEGFDRCSEWHPALAQGEAAHG